MTFRIGTHDGTVVIVDEGDLDLITAYLVLRGYPPTSVEAIATATVDSERTRSAGSSTGTSAGSPFS